MNQASTLRQAHGERKGFRHPLRPVPARTEPPYPTSSTLSGETVAYAMRVISPTASIPWT